MAEQVSPLAGKPIDPSRLVDVPRLVTAYFTGRPDPAIAAQRVAFGTSGHRGSAFDDAFNEGHILAISQAICDHRRSKRIDGPLFIGIDTHALSAPALASALEVLAANGVETMIDAQGGYTPTPVISHAILTYNRNRTSGLADGIVITPSHNPPEDGGFKYNPPMAGRRIPMSPRGWSGPRTISSPPGWRASNAFRMPARCARRTCTVMILLHPMWLTSAPSSIWRRYDQQA